jgi:hypothetical protein
MEEDDDDDDDDNDIYPQNRLNNVPLTFLACPFLFNTSSLQFLKYVKMDPKYLNVAVALISVLSSIFIQCDVWSRSMANTYQRNKQNFIYKNGCAKEIIKKIEDRKNKK